MEISALHTSATETILTEKSSVQDATQNIKIFMLFFLMEIYHCPEHALD
jgi:hypothetical protein